MAEDNKKEMMLKGIVEIGEISYKEELDRKKLLLDQSSSLVITQTLLIAFLGIVLPISLQYAEKTRGLVFITFIISIFLLFASLICVLLVQWRWKYKKFRSAYNFFEKVKSNYEQYSEWSSFLQEKMDGYGDITETESENNDKRAKLIVASHILIMSMMFILVIFSFIIIGIEIS